MLSGFSFIYILNDLESINVKRQGDLVTLTMETTRFRPGDSVRGRFDFSNSQIDCLQVCFFSFQKSF